MSKITRAQLAAMLLITDVFALFCLTGDLSPAAAAAYAAACAVQLILALPLAFLVKRGKIPAKPIRAISLVYLLIWGGRLLSMLWDAADMIFIPPENSGSIWGHLLTAGLIAAVCAYASSEGVKALARASVIAAALGAACLAVVVVNAAFTSDWGALALTKSSRGFWGDILHCFALSGSAAGLVLFLPRTKGSPTAASTVYFITKGVISAIIVFTAALVTDGIMQLADHPVITAAQLSQPFTAQRIDALFLMIFAIFAVFALAVQTCAAAETIAELIPRFKKFRSISAVAVMIGTAFLPVGDMIWAAALVMLTALPLVQLAFESTDKDAEVK